MSDADDLDALVSELNADAPAARASAGAGDAQLTRLREWLEQVVRRSASDLLLVAGAPPSMRIDGGVVPLEAIFLIDHVVRNAEHLSHVPRVIDVVNRTAPSLHRLGHAV